MILAVNINYINFNFFLVKGKVNTPYVLSWNGALSPHTVYPSLTTIHLEVIKRILIHKICLNCSFFNIHFPVVVAIKKIC